MRSAIVSFFFFQAEDGIRDLVRSRGLGDVYKRQVLAIFYQFFSPYDPVKLNMREGFIPPTQIHFIDSCLLYTSDAADERSSVDLGGRRIIKKKTNHNKKNDSSVTQNYSAQQQ